MRKEFNTRISLIGMSGAGKSHWTQKFSEQGFTPFYCDDLIEKKIAHELELPGGGAASVGEWMGFPFQKTYQERETRYLECEKSILSEIFDLIRNGRNGMRKKLVIDTTGSVIYTGDQLLKTLRLLTTVVHLEVPDEIQEQMLSAYLNNRRPVLWREFFQKRADESTDEAIARCYPHLMRCRERLYRQHAHVTIHYEDYSRSDFEAADMLEIVSSQRFR
jgi:shikimate kinase